MAAAAPAAPLRALEGQWRYLGPDGGGVSALAVSAADPQTVFAVTDGGVFRSSDGGAGWAPTNRGLVSVSATAGGGHVSCLALDPADPSAIYAGLFGEGVARSSDGGATWTHPGGGSENRGVVALALDPTSPSRLFAATFGGLIRSGDGGVTWRTLSRGLPPPPSGASLVVLDPSAPRTVVYAVFGDLNPTQNVLYKSGNGGATWRSISSGALSGQLVETLAVAPGSPQTLYAGTAAGVFQSCDGGASWRRTALDAGTVHALAVHPARAETVYAGTDLGVYRTTDGGAHWAALNQGINSFSPVRALAFSPDSPRVLYAAAANAEGTGVFISRNAGGSWRSSSRGLSALSADAFAVDPRNPNTFWLGSSGNLYRSLDRGASWLRLHPAGACLHAYPIRFALDATRSSTVSFISYGGQESQVCQTRNGGYSWDPVLAPHTELYDLEVDPLTPRTLYATGRGIWRSTDGGATWSQLGGEPAQREIYLLLISPSHPSTWYAATSIPGTQAYVLLRSSDGGLSWSHFGLPPDLDSLALDPADAATLYASAAGTLLKSGDGGATWTTTSKAFAGRTVWVQTARAAPGSLFIAVDSDNVYVSADGGTSRVPLGERPEHTSFVNYTLTVDPGDPRRTYVGSYSGGLLEFTASP
jgi:photosystem II stability/assembly factor-like uncharacterized protein